MILLHALAAALFFAGNVRAVEVPTLVCDGDPWTYAELASPSAVSQIQNAMTLEAWVKWGGPLPKKSQQVICIKGEVQKTWSNGLALTDGRLTYKTRLTDLVASEPIARNQWTHLAIAISGSSATFYVNGQAVGTAAGAVIENFNYPFYVGGYWPTWGLSVTLHSAPFNGEIAELAIWNFCLDARQILSTSRKLKTGNEAGLVAAWRGLDCINNPALSLSRTHRYWHDEKPAAAGNLKIAQADIAIANAPEPETPAPTGAGIPCPADFDGDDAVDPALYFPQSGSWIIRLSSTGKDFRAQWGWAEALPVPADYDGDGFADFAVLGPGREWIIFQSRSKTTKRIKQ